MPTAPAYEVEDRSILLPHYRRFLVEPVLRHVPAGVDPNLITHLGHAFCLASLLVMLVSRASASWGTLVAIALLLAYLWCDNADGAHARRTGQTSTGGEYLDHGLDLLNCSYIGIVSAYALGAGDETPGILVASLIAGAAALTTWEQAVTGVFRLGTLNQIESLSFLSLVLASDALFGTELLTRLSLFGITAKTAIAAVVSLTIGFNILRGIVLVRRAGQSIFPGAALLALHGIVYLLHALGKIASAAAFLVMAATAVAFGARMLLTRLRRQEPSSAVGITLAVPSIVLLAASAVVPSSAVSAGAIGIALVSIASAVSDTLRIGRCVDAFERDRSTPEHRA